jgi:hypothetical protein
MIDVSPFEDCVCKKMANAHALCDGALTLSENGKKVKLSLRSGEDARALAIDGCVLKDKDQQPKCDGLFVFLDNRRIAVLLVELKGVDIRHAFEQLAYVRNIRQEYKQLIASLMGCGKGKPVERALGCQQCSTIDVGEREIGKSA